MSQPPQHLLMPPPPVVALIGWVLPGAGYVMIGQRLRGLVIGLTILLLFAGGLLIGGMRVIDPPTTLGFQPVLQKPWFIGQVMAGPVTMVANYAANHWTITGPSGLAASPPWSHARVYEIGVLYTAVAGMLNLMAIIDSSYRASNEGAR